MLLYSKNYSESRFLYQRPISLFHENDIMRKRESLQPFSRYIFTGIFDWRCRQFSRVFYKVCSDLSVIIGVLSSFHRILLETL